MIYVVGNTFKNISNGKNILTYTEVIKLLQNGQLSDVTISIEQGVSEEAAATLEILSDCLTIRINSYYKQATRASGKLTHKSKIFNTLISDPIEKDKEVYESFLMIDERCAELSDHVTGKHIQFMVLLEAARQMVNAVTEKFYSNQNMIYLANDMNIVFKSFVYPFGTKLVYEIIEKKFKTAGNGKMKVKINVLQNKKVCSEIIFDFTILDRGFVTTIEDRSLTKLAA